MLAIIQMLTNWSWPNLFGFWECNSLAWLQFLCNLTGWTSIVYNTIYQYCLSTVPIKCITSCIPFVRVGLLKFCPCHGHQITIHFILAIMYFTYIKALCVLLSLLPLTIFKGTYMYIYIYIYIYTHIQYTHIWLSNLTVAT